ncbi:MAG: hypothetical protein AseanaTS_19970 [Candidatus Pelagadaptatus aseana]|uniref:TIGR04211 family SH3 domain-containing protein n=1 Tax=Candidatus Pelagadaptatus aseana TaxID=3120508 RepID=UPI0039B214BC
MKKIFVVFALLVYASASYAEYRWIRDTLYVPLRSGMGNSFRILDKGLISGTRLTLIEITEDANDSWAKVKTEEGVEGWVRAQYLIDTPTAAQKLATANSRIAKLEKQNGELRDNLSGKSSSNKTLNAELKAAQKQAKELAKELSELKRISGESISLYENHQKLMETHQLVQTQLDILKADNERLRGNNDQQFILAGAAAVLLGVALTWLIPKIFNRRKKYSEWG